MAIVKKIEDVREIVSIQADVKMEKIQSFCEDVELDYIEPLLGATLYNALNAKTSYKDNELKLYGQILSAVVPLALHHATDVINVGITSQGMTVTKDDHSAPASEVRSEKFKRKMLDIGHKRLDRLIRFIDENKADFADLDQSQWILLQPIFLSGVKEFQKYCDINGSYYIYLKLMPIIKRHEERTILDFLGKTLYDDIKADLTTPKSKNLLPYINAITSNYSFSEGIRDLAIKIDDRGVTIFNNNYAETVNIRQPLSANSMNDLINRKEQLGLQAVDNMINFLHENIDDYPEFKESGNYDDGESVEEFVKVESGDGFTLL